MFLIVILCKKCIVHKNNLQSGRFVFMSCFCFFASEWKKARGKKHCPPDNRLFNYITMRIKPPTLVFLTGAVVLCEAS